MRPRHAPLVASLAALATLAAAAPAAATVEAWLEVAVPMKHPQGSDVCLRKHTMIGSFGVPMLAVMEDLVTPQLAWSQATGDHVDVNEITRGTTAGIVARYVSDGYNEATRVWSYSMTLDVTALSSRNGTSLVGRADTLRRAKLFLVAAADNFAKLSGNRFQLRVTFVGLPSQTGLPGTRLNATTAYAYSASSALLAAYRAQLINAESMCGAGF